MTRSIVFRENATIMKTCGGTHPDLIIARLDIAAWNRAARALIAECNRSDESYAECRDEEKLSPAISLPINPTNSTRRQVHQSRTIPAKLLYN